MINNDISYLLSRLRQNLKRLINKFDSVCQNLTFNKVTLINVPILINVSKFGVPKEILRFL